MRLRTEVKKKLEYQRWRKLNIVMIKNCFTVYSACFSGDTYTPDEWEVPLDNLTFHQALGKGQFGQVFYGIMKKEEDEKMVDVEVAIKVKQRERERESIFCLPIIASCVECYPPPPPPPPPPPLSLSLSLSLSPDLSLSLPISLSLFLPPLSLFFSLSLILFIVVSIKSCSLSSHSFQSVHDDSTQQQRMDFLKEACVMK